MESISALSLLASIGVLSLLCQWFAWRIRVPSILPLLVCGLLVGPVFHLLDPDALFGDLLFPMVSLAVAIILFEGSLTLDFKEIRGHGAMVRNLVSIGMLATFAVIGVFTHFIMGLSWELSALFGALVVVTGPTVIVPMLRSIRPTAKVANILRWEGIIIDPIGALLAVLVYEFIISSRDTALIHAMEAFGITLFVGFGFGWAAAKLLIETLNRNWLPHYLQNPATLTFMLGIYAMSNFIQHESGLLTVTIMGMVMANSRKIDIDGILEFKESLSVLLISALFIILAARLDLSHFVTLGLPMVFLLLVILLIARPLAVLLSSYKLDLNWKEKALLSWIAPRGIVAAAVSALFALKLENAGWQGADILVPMVFMVIITTVVLQSLTAKFLAVGLGLQEPPAQGFLIFGANDTARAIAKMLMEQNVKVRIADTNWENLSQARMEGLPVYFGNPASEHATHHVDLSGIGRLLILSPYKQLNPMVSMHFLDWFGKDKVFGLGHENDLRASHQSSGSYTDTLGLFGEGMSYSKLASLRAKKALVKKTQLTDNFTFEHYLEQYGSRALPLFAIDENNYCHVFTAQKNTVAKPGWTVIAMVSPEADTDTLSNHEGKLTVTDASTSLP
jgi:NhaP-type Na+/H+ or K+/H+ antiporter